jgi:hypothetical protein
LHNRGTCNGSDDQPATCFALGHVWTARFWQGI